MLWAVFKMKEVKGDSPALKLAGSHIFQVTNFGTEEGKIWTLMK